MSLKVCFFINTLDNSGGTERITTVLAQELVNRNFDVHIISWYGGNKSFYALHPRIKTHHIFESSDGNIYKDYINSLYIYRRLLKQINPNYLIDVCVALSLLSIPATLGKKIKLISWEHFNTNVSWNAYTAKLSRNLAARYAHKVVTLTSGDKENYEINFGSRNAITIPNPVTIKPNGRADLDQKFVLAIGRFTHQKGFDLLLNIWKEVSEKMKDWQLRIVGDGELKLSIIKLAEELSISDRIEFIEPTNDISKFYLSSSIFLMTSRFEGLPLVLIEAKAFGLPIISYDCDTGPRDIINNKIDGVLIPFLDSEKFANELLNLMNDQQLRQSYSDQALGDLARFDIDSILARWLAILK